MPCVTCSIACILLPFVQFVLPFRQRRSSTQRCFVFESHGCLLGFLWRWRCWIRNNTSTILLFFSNLCSNISLIRLQFSLRKLRCVQKSGKSFSIMFSKREKPSTSASSEQFARPLNPGASSACVTKFVRSITNLLLFWHYPVIKWLFKW